MQWTKHQFSLIAIVAITSFMGTFLISSVNIALPSIEKSLHLDAITLSWVITSFLLSTAIFLLPIGRIGDNTGVARVFKLGIIIFTLASAACSMAPSGMWLIVFRFIQGIGTAFTSTTGPAILVAAFSAKQRGKVLGIAVSAVYLGLAIGPFAGGFLTQFAGWRSIFYVSTLLGIITAIVTLIFLKRDKISNAQNKEFDFRGAIFYMLGLTAMVYGSSLIPNTLGWALMAAGALFIIGFWMHENKTHSPILDTQLFTRNRLFRYSNLAALINYSATFAIIFLLSLYLQKVKALTPREAGTILIAQPIMMAIFSPIAGKLSDKIQPRYIATLGMAMCTVGLAFFTFINTETPMWSIVAILLWVGLGFAFFSSPNMNTIMSSVEKSQYGLASGTAATMRVVGQITSMTIATLFFASIIGKVTIDNVATETFIFAVKWSFAVFTVISIAGIYFSYDRGKIIRE
ncbi:MAG: MFS transporter [Salinivirgaceae bacterium]|jgi:EmrB/QacA subfamily drug resistance transporter|nr:MFS transporter [Salinivirgaceae bacterium]